LLPGTIELRVNAPADGANTANDGNLFISFTIKDFGDAGYPTGFNVGEYLDFTVTAGPPIVGVFVKGGDNGNLYTYNPPVTSDSNLHTPLNPQNHQYFDVSHVSFCYAGGNLEWEKRAHDTGALLGGATFSISPNALACAGGTLTSVTDNDSNDADPDDGQIKLANICTGTYTITETTPPPGYTADPDPTRSQTLTFNNPNQVIGTQGTAQQCPDENPANDNDEQDFCNERLPTREETFTFTKVYSPEATSPQVEVTLECTGTFDEIQPLQRRPRPA
jgi:hypothetical protein